MNYVNVESSQIASIGFGEGHYGPETLGIRFHASNKSTSSEYHYGGVSPRTHHALMSSPSIGSYFGQNIKSRPDLYPYTKVDAVIDAPLNPALRFDNVSTDNALPAPSTALSVIDTMADDILFTPGAVTDAQLASGREWYLAEAKKYDISTEKARIELKRFARPLQKLRTGIEARAKELTGSTKRKIAAIDAEKRRLVNIVGGIEDEVLAPLTAWENEEESRKVRLATIVTKLSDKGQWSYATISELETVISQLESFDLSSMQEYKASAESAISASLRVLKPELERRKVAEDNEKELAELRRKLADRESEAKAESDRIEAEAKSKREWDAMVESERKRAADIAAAEYVAMEKRAADEQHCAKFNGEAVAALVEHCCIDMAESTRVLTAISKGLIPHITIMY